MSLQFGFSLRNSKNENINIDLISFGGWNMKETLHRIEDMGEKIPVNEEDAIPDYKIDLQKLYSWGNRLYDIISIFNKVSNREIEYSLFNKKVSKEYADLCYDLDIEYDDIIIQSLIRMALFIRFLETSDLFEEYLDGNKDNYLVLWESY